MTKIELMKYNGTKLVKSYINYYKIYSESISYNEIHEIYSWNTIEYNRFLHENSNTTW